MRITKQFDCFGVSYKTRHFSAVEALAILDEFKELPPTVSLGLTSVYANGTWRSLSDAANINNFVYDAAGFLHAHIVLATLIQMVSDFNFDVLSTWEPVRIPRRFRSDANTKSVDRTNPIIAALICSDKATLKELEEYYSLEDAVLLFDVMITDNVNQALVQENSAAKVKR